MKSVNMRRMCSQNAENNSKINYSAPPERFQKFSEGRTSGEAALTAHNEERKAF